MVMTALQFLKELMVIDSDHITRHHNRLTLHINTKDSGLR